jgi:hypothetical protein
MNWRANAGFAFDNIPIVAASTWLRVLARGLIDVEVWAMEFFRTRVFVDPATLSRRPLRGLDEGVVVE